MSHLSTSNRWRLIACISLGLAGACYGQTIAPAKNVLTNNGVITLAKAGFNEEFIIDVIVSSRTQFDTSVDGLADLAKQGITERLIRVMMNPGIAGPMPATSSPSSAVAGGSMMPMNTVSMAPPSPERPVQQVMKPSPVRMAVSSKTPLYQWSSLFWGLWKRKVGVGSNPEAVPVPAVHLGTMYDNVRVTRQYIPLGGSSPQYQTASYVVQ